MMYNGVDYKNFESFAKAYLGYDPEGTTENNPEGAENFIWAIQTYQSSIGELTDEDLTYIKSIDEEIWADLGFVVDHWELQRWDDPKGEVVECYDYFSMGSALRDYNSEIMNGGYWRIIAVNSDGMPEDNADEISNF